MEQLIEVASKRDLGGFSTTGSILIAACRIFVCSRCIRGKQKRVNSS